MSNLSYFVTGANSGCGFEATRMLALRLSENTDNKVSIYLLCRSEEKAKLAIEEIRKSLETNHVHLKFMKFNAYDDESTIRENIRVALEAEENPSTIAGILLNAGGFGEKISHKRSTESIQESPMEACAIAKMNLIGHIFLLRNLLAACPTDSKTRIVPVASEAAFCTPGMDYQSADFVSHLSGNAPTKDTMMGADYAWIKGILALYWTAYARRHPEHHVTIVSPGAVPSTNLFDTASSALKIIAGISQWPCFGGKHTVEEGAERYVMALLGTGPFEGEGSSSGEFWASRKGFAKDFGNVAELKKGKFVTDEKLQDKAWEAVQSFV